MLPLVAIAAFVSGLRTLGQVTESHALQSADRATATVVEWDTDWGGPRGVDVVTTALTLEVDTPSGPQRRTVVVDGSPADMPPGARTAVRWRPDDPGATAVDGLPRSYLEPVALLGGSVPWLVTGVGWLAALGLRRRRHSSALPRLPRPVLVTLAVVTVAAMAAYAVAGFTEPTFVLPPP